MALVVLHTRGIAHTFLKIYSWSPGAGFIPIISTKLSFMHTKRFNTCFKKWVQFCVGAIPRLPYFIYLCFEDSKYISLFLYNLATNKDLPTQNFKNREG